MSIPSYNKSEFPSYAEFTVYEDLLKQINSNCIAASNSSNDASMKAIAEACLGLYTGITMIGERSPYLIENSNNFRKVIETVKPLNLDLAENLRALQASATHILRDDLPPYITSNGPIIEEDILVSKKSADDFVLKVQSLLEAPHGDNSPSSSNLAISLGVTTGIALLGLATFKTYSLLKKLPSAEPEKEKLKKVDNLTTCSKSKVPEYQGTDNREDANKTLTIIN